MATRKQRLTKRKIVLGTRPQLNPLDKLQNLKSPKSIRINNLLWGLLEDEAGVNMRSTTSMLEWILTLRYQAKVQAYIKQQTQEGGETQQDLESILLIRKSKKLATKDFTYDGENNNTDNI